MNTQQQNAYRPYQQVTPLAQLDAYPTFIDCPYCRKYTWTKVRKAVFGQRNNPLSECWWAFKGACIFDKNNLKHICSECNKCVAVQHASPYGAKWEQAIVVAYPKKDGKEAKPPVPAPPEPPKVFVNAPQTAPYELQASFHPPRTPELEAAERPVELEAPQGRPRAISEVSALSDYSQEKEAVPGPRQNHQSYARR